MLSDWERHQWRTIERALAPVVVESTQRARRTAAVSRAMFPSGFFGVALLYMLLALHGAFLALFGEVVLVCLGLWGYVELRIALERRPGPP
jgi:hypothetical protein